MKCGAQHACALQALCYEAPNVRIIWKHLQAAISDSLNLCPLRSQSRPVCGRGPISTPAIPYILYLHFQTQAFQSSYSMPRIVWHHPRCSKCT